MRNFRTSSTKHLDCRSARVRFAGLSMALWNHHFRVDSLSQHVRGGQLRWRLSKNFNHGGPTQTEHFVPFPPPSTAGGTNDPQHLFGHHHHRRAFFSMERICLHFHDSPGGTTTGVSLPQPPRTRTPCSPRRRGPPSPCSSRSTDSTPPHPEGSPSPCERTFHPLGPPREAQRGPTSRCGQPHTEMSPRRLRETQGAVLQRQDVSVRIVSSTHRTRFKE